MYYFAWFKASAKDSNEKMLQHVKKILVWTQKFTPSVIVRVGYTYYISYLHLCFMEARSSLRVFLHDCCTVVE